MQGQPTTRTWPSADTRPAGLNRHTCALYGLAVSWKRSEANHAWVAWSSA